MTTSRDEKALNGAMVSLGASRLVVVTTGKVALSQAASSAVSAEAAAFIAKGLTNAYAVAPATAKLALAGGEFLVEGITAIAEGVAVLTEGTAIAAAIPYIAAGVVAGGLIYAGYQMFMYNKEQNQASFA